MSKKKTKTLLIAIVIIEIIFAGLLCFIAYNKGLLTNKNTSTEEKENKKEKAKELDINSSLVQNLYAKVSSVKNSSHGQYWIYTFYDNSNPIEDNYYASSMPKLSKMAIVGQNLDTNERIVIAPNSAEYQLIHNEYAYQSTKTNGQTITQSVKYNNQIQNTQNIQYAYQKKYIERIYKDIFGSNQTLDTDIPIVMDKYHAITYVYIKELDMYVQHIIITGGTTGPGGYSSTISKAILEDGEIKIYEDVKLTDYSAGETSPPKITEAKYIYTFIYDDENLNYIFDSREKNTN